MELSPHSLTAALLNLGIRSLIGLSVFRPYRPSSALPPRRNTQRYTKIYFGENQLLRSSISFSLLTPPHPRVLNNSPVRTSSCISTTFILGRVSSPRFGFYTCCWDSLLSHALLRLAFATPSSQLFGLRLATHIKSLDHSSIGTRLSTRTSLKRCAQTESLKRKA